MEKKKIMVIDDEPDVVTFLTTLLEENGYETCSALDGVEGLDKIQSERPDLICLDICMPAPSGVRVYRELRADPAMAWIPVVMVTGLPGEFKQFISRRRQVPPPDGYVAKPFEPAALLATVDRLLTATPTRPH